MPFGYTVKSEEEIKTRSKAILWLVQTIEENYEHLPKERLEKVKPGVDKIKRDLLGYTDGKERKMHKQRVIVKDVDIFSPRHPEICDVVLEHLKSLIERSIGVALNIRKLSNPSERKGHQVPLIVICLGKSRLGADVDEAIAPLGEVGDKSTWVMIVHNKQMHALPMGPTEAILIDEKYKKLAGYIDVAFQADQGLYRCDLNDMALGRMSSILS